MASVTLHGIELSEEGVAELRDGKRSLFVARGAIRSIALDEGLTAERPAAMILLGAAVSLPSLFLAYLFLHSILTHTMAWRTKAAIGSVGLAAIGYALFEQGLRRGVFLRVVVDGDERKLTVARALDAEARRDLVARARELGYAIATR